MNDCPDTPRTLTVAFVLTIGCAIAWGALAAGTIDVVASLLRHKDTRTHENLVVLEDGEVAVQRQEPVDSQEWTFFYESLGGEPLSAEQAAGWIAWHRGIRVNEEAHHDFQYQRLQARKYIDVHVGYRAAPVELYWYFARDGQSGYFVGYDRESRRPVAYAGRSGFQEQPIPPAERLPLESFVLHNRWITADSAEGLYVYTEGRLDLFDFAARRVTRVLPGETIRSVDFVRPERDRDYRPSSDENERPDDPVRLGIATEDGEIRLLDADANPVATYTMPAPLSETPFRLHRLENGTALAIAWNRQDSSQELFWFNAEGEIFERGEWQPAARPSYVSTPIGPVLAAVFAAPLPELAVTTLFVAASRNPAAEVGADAEGEIRSVLLWLLPVCVVCLVLASLADRRRKRFGLPRSYAWMAFVFLFGLPGYLAFLTHRKWPALVPCSSCDANTPCNRPECTRCGAAFPTPRLTGTEVFC